MNKPQFSDDELKKRLTPMEYHVLREKGTEPPFTGKFIKDQGSGTYNCAVCNAPLFSSDTKFESYSGWPSFHDVVNNKAVVLSEDRSFGMVRTEVNCATCGSHLGHLFNDAYSEKNKNHFCINSVSLKFEPNSKSSEGVKT